MAHAINLLEKTVISGNDEHPILTFAMPNYQTYTNYTQQAKPLLDQCSAAITIMNEQTTKLYTQLGDIATNCDKLIDQANKQADKNKEDFRRQVDDMIEDHRKELDKQHEKILTLEEEKENLKKRSQEKNTEIQEMIDLMANTSKAFENRIQALIQENKELKTQLEKRTETNSYAPAIKTMQETLKRLELLQPSSQRDVTSGTSSSERNIESGSTHSHPIRATPSVSATSIEQQGNSIKIKLNNTLQSFSGKEHENVSNWIYNTERTMEGARLSDAEKVITAANYLKDIAQKEYMLYERTHGPPDWAKFKAFMAKQFTPRNQSDAIRNQLRHLKQTSTVKQYYIDFRSLIIQLDDMSETDKVKSFLDGLKPSISVWVRYAEKKTLEDAYDHAQHVEAQGFDRITQQPSIGQSYNTNQSNRDRTCAYCHIIGHTANECNKLKRDRPINRANNSNIRFNRSNQQRDNSVVCCICNEPGHIGENCRKNKHCTICRRNNHTDDECYFKSKSMMTRYNDHRVNDKIEIISWPATINGRETLAVLDSASHVSILSHSLATAWDIPIEPTQSTLETSTGERNQAIGQTPTMTVEFEGTSAEVKFLITNLDSYDSLLGLDWFKQTGVILDPKNETFTVPKRSISTTKAKEQEEEDLATYVNFLNLEKELDERDDFALFDDYAYYPDKPATIDKMRPATQVSIETEEKLNALLKENERTFANSVEKLGCCNDVELEIETTTETPIHCAPYRQSPSLTREMEKEVNTLLEVGIIRKGGPGTWCMPAFTITQKGKKRMVINLKKLNKVIKPYKFPQPRTDDHLDGLQGATFFSQIDLRKGFYQLAIKEKSRHKIGFVTPFGIYEFNRLPFGISNGPAIFCSVMQNIFGDLKFIKCYIDDITIASKSEKEHLEHIEEVIKRLKKYNLKINPEKCRWFADEIEVLGHIVNKNGINMDPKKVEAIKQRKPPSNKKQLQQFLGMTNYYRKFIEGYSKIAAPLHQLTSNDVQWVWTTQCQQAFDNLKVKLTEYPILQTPDFDRPFILHTDASHIALGAILAQQDDQKREYVCYYASKLLKPSERTYGITELECLAIIWGINNFSTYLYGNNFTIYTDNEALKWLQGTKATSSRLTRWSILLEQFTFEIKHRPGKHHTNVDALSRPVLLTKETDINELSDQSTKLLDPYEDDALMHYIKYRKHLPGISRKRANRIERNSHLYNIREDGTLVARKNEKLQFDLTVPRPETRKELVLREHELGHAKAQKIQASLSAKNLFWKNMLNFIEKCIETCEICLRYDKEKETNNPAVPSFIDNIFDKLGIDLINGLPTSSEGYASLLVIVEYLTKFAWAFPLKTKSSEEITKHLTTHISTFGPPKCIISDQGTEFVNEQVENLCRRMGIIKRTTSAYNPRANGQCERTNQTIIKILTKHCDENPNSWPETLDIVLLAYRTSIHSSTGKTPFELMFGRRFGNFLNWEEEQQLKNKIQIENRQLQLKTLFEKTHEEAIQNIANAQEKQFKNQNAQSNASHDHLRIGDTVYIKNCKTVKNKFEREFEGPYYIRDRNTSTGNYLLENAAKIPLKDTYPRWKLKPAEYHSETTPQAKTDTINDKTIIRILHVQKIGRGCRCQVQYPNNKTEWVPGQTIDKKLIEAFNNQQEKTSQRTNFRKLNMLTIICFLFSLVFKTIVAQNITGTFKYCPNNELTRIVNLEMDCKHPKEPNKQNRKIKELYKIKFPTNIYVLSKNKYYANEIGYQCYKSRKTIKIERNYVFWSKTTRTKESIPLSRLECMTMIESKRCNNNLMNCNENGCSFIPDETEQDTPFYDQRIDLYQCSFHKKRIISERNDSQLFFSTSKPCIFADLHCILYDSTIIWENVTKHDCPFTKIHYGEDYEVSGKNQAWDQDNLLFSDYDGLTFQITEARQECGIRMFRTTEDLLILIENDEKSREHSHIETQSTESNFNRQHDINNMILAETDAIQYKQWRLLQDRVDLAFYKECMTLKSLITIISKESDSYNTINDLDGNEIITYSNNNIIYLPICDEATNVHLRNTTECFTDTPITFELKGKQQEGFMTANSFIKDHSNKINCKLVAQHQIIKGNNLLLIRKGLENKIFHLSGVIMHDLSHSSHIHQKINLNHHETIVGNYEIPHRSDREDEPDTEGKFYSIPNDKQYSEIEYRSSVITSIDDMSDKIVGLALNSSIINKITSTIIGAIIIYSAVSIALTFRRKQRKAAHQRRLEKQELRRSEPLRITIRDPQISSLVNKYSTQQTIDAIEKLN